MGVLERIGATVAREFADLGDVEQLTQLAVRILLAALLGGLLGVQRERHRKPAGVRTHMLVAMGSALLVLLPLQAGMDGESVSRVIQGLLAGIGLLCAGTILKLGGEEQVYGLTSAAGLWMTAAIGVAVGFGRETTAVFAAVLAFAILALEGPLTRLALLGREPPAKD